MITARENVYNSNKIKNEHEIKKRWTKMYTLVVLLQKNYSKTYGQNVTHGIIIVSKILKKNGN